MGDQGTTTCAREQHFGEVSEEGMLRPPLWRSDTRRWPRVVPEESKPWHARFRGRKSRWHGVVTGLSCTPPRPSHSQENLPGKVQPRVHPPRGYAFNDAATRASSAHAQRARLEERRMEEERADPGATSLAPRFLSQSPTLHPASKTSPAGSGAAEERLGVCAPADLHHAVAFLRHSESLESSASWLFIAGMRINERHSNHRTKLVSQSSRHIHAYALTSADSPVALRCPHL